MSTANPVAQADTPPMLEMRGITKRFPGVIANENVTFDVRPERCTHYWVKTVLVKAP